MKVALQGSDTNREVMHRRWCQIPVLHCQHSRYWLRRKWKKEYLFETGAKSLSIACIA